MWSRRPRSSRTISRCTRRPRRGGGAARLVLAATLASLLAAACGIPQFVFLAPPVLGEVSSLPPTVSFSHDEINNIDDSFRGYELYYKFYDPNAGDVATAFSADRAAIEAAAPGSVVSTLAARDYLRVYAAGSNAPPALVITAAEREETFSVSVVFPDGATIDEAAASWNAEGPRSVVLLRDQNALGDPTEPVGFAPSDITAADADTPGTLPAGGTVEMGLAIAAYGIDYITGTFAELYSTAVVADQLLGVSYQ